MPEEKEYAVEDYVMAEPEVVYQIEQYSIAEDGTLQPYTPSKDSTAANAAEGSKMTADTKHQAQRRALAEGVADMLLVEVPHQFAAKLREQAVTLLLKPASGFDEKGCREWIAQKLDEWDGLPGGEKLSLIAKGIAPEWVSPLAS